MGVTVASSQIVQLGSVVHSRHQSRISTAKRLQRVPTRTLEKSSQLTVGKLQIFLTVTPPVGFLHKFSDDKSSAWPGLKEGGKMHVQSE